jgi:hypothetical protein
VFTLCREFRLTCIVSGWHCVAVGVTAVVGIDAACHPKDAIGIAESLDDWVS